MIILLHAFATFFMTGLIWFVQVVHYPMLDEPDKEHYPRVAQRHQRLTGYVVMPVMLLELGTAVLLVWLAWQSAGNAVVLTVLNLATVVGIWLSTFLLQVPLHRRLLQAWSAGAHRSLVRGNWLRTGLWSLRSAFLLFYFWFLLRGETS